MSAVQTRPRYSVPTFCRRSAAVLPVLLLHGVLLGLLMQSRPEHREIKTETKPPMAVRFIEVAAPNAPATPTALRAPDERTQPTQLKPQPPLVTAPAITAATPDTTPQAASTESAITQALSRTDTAPIAVAPPRPASAPLNLSLPSGSGTRPAARSPASLATQDIRANSERVNFAEKLAQELGSDNRRTEENLGNGSIRVRSGADCVVVVESRAGQLDAMGQTSRPAPRGVKPCK